MSQHTVGTTAAPAADATRRTRDWAVAAFAAVIALLALWAVFFDNGQAIAATENYLHEFSHDGRHLFGAPCH
ncbi:CbtB domain-containing protein [Streptomyces sp. NBC_01803]|uniref:CbtB domain-containing protein n=1 Tax=Streptomyces sp. NBC_01803 TaxID=2975946 RepID=UPI002DDAF2DD|nr:CbtB-domain containing protein [Streptomyces sp. NBC_01803]WSA44376.1 CbtB-domain containing protein [Streptomyces sp. NBC_01803]